MSDLDDMTPPTSDQTIDCATVDGGERMRTVMELLDERYD